MVQQNKIVNMETDRVAMKIGRNEALLIKDLSNISVSPAPSRLINLGNKTLDQDQSEPSLGGSDGGDLLSRCALSSPHSVLPLLSHNSPSLFFPFSDPLFILPPLPRIWCGVGAS